MKKNYLQGSELLHNQTLEENKYPKNTHAISAVADPLTLLSTFI